MIEGKDEKVALKALMRCGALVSTETLVPYQEIDCKR
jgi:hypothetical protein